MIMHNSAKADNVMELIAAIMLHKCEFDAD